MMQPLARLLGTTLTAATISTVSIAAHELTFDDRVQCTAAIERVYYSHQVAATTPFEQAVPRTVMTFLASEDWTVAMALPA